MKKLCFLIILFFPCKGYFQTLDYETITTSKPLKISGALSASGVYYNSNTNNSREPFTYYLQGAMNFNIYSFSIPISYSYSNQGENLGYKLPFNFNRLSLHPKYKWITAHIGSVSMTFSPYTLNGHQFTGGGVDLTPPGDFKISAMSGRLLKATEDDGEPNTLPAFNRMGYGLKTMYEKDKYKIGLIGFYAKDNINSISQIPEERDILPKENLVLSLNGEVKINTNFSVQAEYASTAITKDLRAEEDDSGKTGIASFLFNNRSSTEYYTALKTALNYTLNRTSVGLGYERIDPGYETLGAYFFNNDFENITLNAASSFFKDKLGLAFNIGYQQDDLNNQKANNTNRIVGAVNANLALSEKVNISSSYSNFRTYTNVKPNQFDDINDEDLLDNEFEDFNYRQLSQTADLNINWTLLSNEKQRQNINFNYNLNDVANEQGGVVRIGDGSTFHNVNTAYSIGFIPTEIDVTAAINYTYNTIGTEDATTWGPTLSIGKRFFEKTLNARLATSYNASQNTSSQSAVTNFRGVVSYVFKEQHNFSLNMIQLFRNTSAGSTPNVNEFTATFGYNYTFGLKRPHIKKGEPREKRNYLKFFYRENEFEGTLTEITQQIKKLSNEKDIASMPSQKRADLELLTKAMEIAEATHKSVYKEEAIAYLDALFEYEDFLEKYNQWIYMAYEKLIQEAERADYDLQNEYMALLAQVNTYNKQEDKDELVTVEKKYVTHREMLIELRKWNLKMEDVEEPEGELKKLKDTYRSKIYVMFKNNKPENKIIDYIEIRLADLYHKVLKETN